MHSIIVQQYAWISSMPESKCHAWMGRLKQVLHGQACYMQTMAYSLMRPRPPSSGMPFKTVFSHCLIFDVG